MTYQPHSLAELVDLGMQFWQKQGEPLAAWLLKLWDTEVDSIICVGDEIERLAYITTHSSLRQKFQNARWLMQGVPNQTYSPMEWINVAIHAVWMKEDNSWMLQVSGIPLLS